MSRFVGLGGRHVNVDEIKEFRRVGKADIDVILKNNERILLPLEYIYDLNGRNHIIQVLPCSKPMVALYREKDGKESKQDVHYLGLCASGQLYGLRLSDGYFEKVDSSDNFEGIYYENELEESGRGR